ncbi:hypothetical protein TDB9533_04769 [Thalassocella blandensis]|nr:hypothetical protein TDB9533_04769 [Thalassocella blandensis]
MRAAFKSATVGQFFRCAPKLSQNTALEKIRVKLLNERENI